MKFATIFAVVFLAVASNAVAVPVKYSVSAIKAADAADGIATPLKRQEEEVPFLDPRLFGNGFLAMTHTRV
ncbi:hypothetical protein BC829DRAFT_405066 [Chytridium lagenaria]|nr:hypothetical protein BC829DRAFT_405066 [Chytridium lagenaria]